MSVNNNWIINAEFLDGYSSYLTNSDSVIEFPDFHENQGIRSEEHTSELQSRETISYAVFCLKKKKKTISI